LLAPFAEDFDMCARAERDMLALKTRHLREAGDLFAGLSAAARGPGGLSKCPCPVH
jgi:hypothetical protein